VWQLAKHLPELLALCGELTERRPRFLLLTCHTPGYDVATLQAMLREAFRLGSDMHMEGRSLVIHCADGRKLPSGTAVYLGNRDCLER
jgi:hypothetical protein